MVSIDEWSRLNGKVALSDRLGYGGLGEAVCQRLAAAGAKVSVAGHDAAPTACADPSSPKDMT
jgi:NAD(P)-dependent dehydrogenase (short-subunit alcohol dehydrogenase family)